MRSKPNKVKVEKYVEDKTKKNDKMRPNEKVIEFLARVHGVSVEELKSAGVI